MSRPPRDGKSNQERPSSVSGDGLSRRQTAWHDGNLGDVFFEFRAVGAYMRVTAIHAKTGFETFALGPLSTRRDDLKKLALRKLVAGLNRRTS